MTTPQTQSSPPLPPTMPVLADKRGIPVCPGDVLKVNHFVGARGKRHFMYKLAAEIDGQLFAVSICELARKPLKNAHRCCAAILQNEVFEIVQGFGPGECVSFEDRQRATRILPTPTTGEETR